MATLGQKPATTHVSFQKQTITGNGGTSYTLQQSVGSELDIAVFINNTRQEPTTAYTASGTTLVMTGAVNSSDNFYVIFLAKAINTTGLPLSAVNTDNISPSAVTDAKIAGMAASKLTGTLASARLPAGSVLQVVSAQTTGSSTNITSTSFVEVSNQLRATITPKFATSKLLVMFQSALFRNTSGSNPWGVQTIFRDGSDIASGTYQFGYTQIDGNFGSAIHSGIKMVDANNTNSTTFALYVRAGSGHTMQLESTDRNITVMEIAQ